MWQRRPAAARAPWSVLLSGALLLALPVRAQDQALETHEEEAVFDEEPAALVARPAQAAGDTVEEEVVFEDEAAAPATEAGPTGAASAAAAATQVEAPPRVPLAAILEHDAQPWLLLLPLLLLGLLAVPVRWRGGDKER